MVFCDLASWKDKFNYSHHAVSGDTDIMVYVQLLYSYLFNHMALKETKNVTEEPPAAAILQLKVTVH